MWNCDSKWIDHKVLAIEPVFVGCYRSKIHTMNGTRYSKLDPRTLLDNACIRYASSKAGRKQATKKLLKYKNKTPFIIAPYSIGVFPTMASSNPECVWIFHHRFKIEELHHGRSRLTFINGTSIIVKTSRHILLKQQERLHTLISITSMLYRETELNFTHHNTYHTPKPF